MFHRAGNRDDKPEFANKKLTVVSQLSSLATSKNETFPKFRNLIWDAKICKQNLSTTLYSSSKFDG